MARRPARPAPPSPPPPDEEWVVHPNAGLAALNNVKALDPALVGPELRRHETNEEALEAAKNAANPLHNHLEWDDAVCGVTHRLGQIASLRSCIRLYDPETDTVKRAFIGLRETNGGHKARYYSPQQVLDSTALQERVLAQWENRLEAMEADMREINDLCDGARELRDRVRTRRESLRTGATPPPPAG